MRKTTKDFKRTIVAILCLVMVTVSFGANNTAKAATNGIVKGPNVPDTSDSFVTTLVTGESTTLTIVNSVLTVKVSSSEYTFKIGNISKTTDAAVVTEKDGLMHILTLAGNYYVFDLYTGVQIVAYRNSVNGKYCSSRNSHAYMVYGKSLINNTYFYELLSSNSVSRELLMTRAEFDIINNGGDPSDDVVETQAPIVVPTVAPTQVPTVAPTQVPTVAPTQVPTVAPTQVPTETRVPAIEIDSRTEFNFEFWWKMYLEGTITWEQFSQAMWQNQWTSTEKTTGSETTYYFYDEQGQLIRTETIKNEEKTETGTGSGSSTETVTGKAEVEVKAEGNGEVTGQAQTETKIFLNNVPVGTTTGTSVSAVTTQVKTKTKTTYHVKRAGNKVKLTRTNNGKTGIICSVYFKKGVAKFDGMTYRGIKYVGYTSKSRQIIMLKKNGKVLIIPRAKGTYGKTYTAKTLKGSWKSVTENTSGLAIRVSDNKSKVLGVKTATPKKIK